VRQNILQEAIMGPNECRKIREIESRIQNAKKSLADILPIWNVMDRKVKNLQNEIKFLEDEKFRLFDGQTIMSFDTNF
jgi:hypothetical protein